MVFSMLFSGLLVPACNRSTAVNSPKTYRGVVIQDVCCLDVIQTLDPDTLGQSTWIDSNTTPLTVRHHVFKVADPCQFQGHNAGDTITFKVIAQEAQNCACCMLFAYTPGTAYPIEEIK